MRDDFLKVIVFGTIRSGKTLIGRAINSNPYASVQQEPFFFYFKICRNIYYRDTLKQKYDYNQPIESDFCIRSDIKNGFRNSLKTLEFNESDIAELKKWTIWQQDVAGSDRAPKVNPFIEELKTGNAVDVLGQLYSILSIAYPKNDLRCLGFTEAWVDNFIETILSLKETRHKVIHCIRDPRQIIASRNFGSNSKYDGKYPLLFLIRHWRRSVAYSIINKDNPDYMCVKYEDLVNFPDEWIMKTCNHLDIPFYEDMMHPERFVDGLNESWKPNTNFKLGKGFSKSSLAKWKNVLSEEMVGVIEYLCGKEMDYFCYERSNCDFELINLLSYKEKREDIIEWLKPYDFDIRNNLELYREITRKYLLDPGDMVCKDIGEGTLDYFFIKKEVFDIISNC